MNISRTYSALLIVAGILFTTAFACEFGRSSSTSGEDRPAATSDPAPTTDKPAPDISGEYNAIGTNPNGGGQYNAQLSVTKRDDVYQFSWISGKNSYDGVGVVTGSSAAVSYTDGTDGKGCGVVLYSIGTDGSLTGKAGYWGVNSAEKETATKSSGSGLDGKYEIEGTNTEGKTYVGTLTVSQSGDGYKFRWDAGNSFEGFGVRTGNMVAVGFGGKQCAFVSYEIGADGTLTGKWGGQGLSSFGTEVAKRK